MFLQCSVMFSKCFAMYICNSTEFVGNRQTQVKVMGLRLPFSSLANSYILSVLLPWGPIMGRLTLSLTAKNKFSSKLRRINGRIIYNMQTSNDKKQSYQNEFDLKWKFFW